MSIREVLDDQGVLSRTMPGFAPRAAQIELAEAIDQAIADGQSLIAEAGTGIGKTFAYLVPILTHGRRAIISTGTKNLQEQLFRRDLPKLMKAMDVTPTVAILKGRNNYLCHYRLERSRLGGTVRQPHLLSLLEKIARWARTAEDGDLSSEAVIVQQPRILPLVTSTSENCLGKECDHYGDCFLIKARRRAMDADLVVVNHHLLFADMALKEGGFGELMPTVDAVIVDEAHKAPDTATQFFGQSLSSRQLNDLGSDILAEAGQLSGGIGQIDPLLDALKAAAQRLRLAMDGDRHRAAWTHLSERPDVEVAMAELESALLDLEQVLKDQIERSRGLESCHDRCQAHLLMLRQLESPDAQGQVSWYQLYQTGFVLHVTPLDIAEQMASRQKLADSWIFTSATISVAGSFDLYTRELGLTDVRTLQVDSPFDYQNNALMYLPEGLPDPSDRQFMPRFVETIIPVIEAARGRTFVLFTSHRNLSIAATMLAERISYPLFVQGEAPRHQLLEDFQHSGQGVLLGASSFWEGVDVSGVALSCVIIDKLPFAAPDDPLLEARLAAIREAGQHPFMHYQLPKASLLLKQGAGRLIRSITDRGVLMLTDARIGSRSYGKHFLANLPPMRRTAQLEDVQSFLQQTESTQSPD